MIKGIFKILRTVLVVLGLLVVVALFATCGGKPSSSDNEAEPEKTQEVETKEDSTEEATPEPEKKEDEAPSDETDADSESDSDRPETEISEDFKAAMDSYEAFFDEYVDFMKRYNEDPSNAELLMEMSDMLSREAEMLEEFEAWEDQDLTTAETAYYLEVQSRITKKLAEVL